MDASTLTTLAIAAVVVALLALVLAVGAQLRLAGVRRDFAALDDDGQTDIARVAATQNHRIDRLTAEVTRLREHVESAEEDVRQSLRNVAVVRYDAFGDMGGHLSWSVALLDDGGNGVVLTSIHGRSEARTYAKNIVTWSCEQQLSPEEEEAVSHARP